MTTAHDFTVRTLDGPETSLSTYAGRVLLIVNTASRCGLTPQYTGLEALHRAYADRGFAVLGFPCNQFGAQEPGTAAEIAGFCSTKYDVTFPLFAKIDVNGANAAPLWAWLKAQKPGILGIEAIKWNFSKFLVDGAGRTVARFAPTDTPESIAPQIERLLPTPPKP